AANFEFKSNRTPLDRVRTERLRFPRATYQHVEYVAVNVGCRHHLVPAGKIRTRSDRSTQQSRCINALPSNLIVMTAEDVQFARLFGDTRQRLRSSAKSQAY